MSEMIDQTEVGSIAESTGPTPLNTILDGGAADVPASPQDHPDSADSVERFERELHTVPVAALHKEKERRKKMDARVKELEDELQRYNDAKWGIEDDAEPIGQHRFDDEGGGHDEWQQNYSRCLNDFTAKHGKGGVEAVDAALKRLTPEQKQEVLGFVGTSRDPVESVHAYVKRLGLLEPGFKPLSIQDVLEGKDKKQPAADTEAIDQRFAELTQREQAIHIAERRAIQAASRSEFIAEHGHETFKELDAVVGFLIQNQHPAVAQLQEAYQSSQRPAHAVASLLSEWGMLPEAAPAQTQPRPQQVFPSNLAGARSVSPRRGPAWSGPTPLADIFDRSRKAS